MNRELQSTVLMAMLLEKVPFLSAGLLSAKIQTSLYLLLPTGALLHPRRRNFSYSQLRQPLKNYRPISLTYVVSKVEPTAVTLGHEYLLSGWRYGLRKHRSTVV